MSELSDLRDGLQTVLVAHNSKLRVYTYPPDEGVNEKPALVLEDNDPLEYDMNLGGNSLQAIIVGTLYLVGGQSLEVRDTLDGYRSATGNTSIKAGIETDPSLNSKADWCVLLRSTNVQRNRDGTGAWEFSCQFEFEMVKSIA